LAIPERSPTETLNGLDSELPKNHHPSTHLP
jgi:hypothetical protein